jgi:hypothetical protein
MVVNIDFASGRFTLTARDVLPSISLTLISQPLDGDIPEFILNHIVNWVIDQVVDNLPPIVLFPAVIEEKVPDTTVTVTVTANKLVINEDEALVAANVLASGMDSYASFVGNQDPEHMEVHKKDCEWAHKIAVRNRKYFCTLEKAFADGFDGCYYCLPEYNHG